jgi:very-short-patch-repair endonuclease
MNPWRRLVEHAGQHHATIGGHVVRELRIPTSSLVAWCEQGRILNPAPDVFVVAGAPETWHQKVAIATASGAAWASHRTAAALWQLNGIDRRQIEVLTTHGRGRRRSDWIVHETRRLRGVDLADVDGIPSTSVARTILDLPAVAHPFKVGQALDFACRHWPGMLDVIVARFLELASRGRKGTCMMRAMLDERLGRGTFTQSGFETLAARLVRSVGLPDPVLQHHVRDGDFSAYLDLAWPPIRWAIECDSLAWHTGKQAHEWDRQRRRQLKRLGWDMVEVTYDDVTKRRRETGEQLCELYRAREKAVLAAFSP